MFRDDGVISVVCVNKRFPPLDTIRPSGRGIKNRFLISFSISQFTSIFGCDGEGERSRQSEKKSRNETSTMPFNFFLAAADIQSITNIFTFQ